MMNFLRNNMKIVFVVTIAGFVVATFAGFGGYMISKKFDAAAKVDNKKITNEAFDRYAALLLRQAQEQKEASLTREEIQTIRKQALQQMIQNEIILKQARKVGFNTSAVEVQNAISMYPIFQKDNKFDLRTYYNALKYYIRQSPREFEKETKDVILSNKVKMIISDSVKVSEAELRNEYARINKGNMKKYESEKQNFYQQYLSQKKMIILNTWFRNVSQSTKVQTNIKE
ncbi:SurA N-terminal domain-containing protein [bacterium]